jgi:hypothetical protein
MLLYDHNLMHLQSMLLDGDGELSPEAAAELDRLAANIETQAESVCKLISEITAEADVLAVEIDRLKKRFTAREKAVHRLKTIIKERFELLGMQKLKTPLYTLSVCRNSCPSISLLDGFTPAALPEQFRRVTIDIDKQAIAAAIKRGEAPPAGVTVQQGTHLRIT